MGNQTASYFLKNGRACVCGNVKPEAGFETSAQRERGQRDGVGRRRKLDEVSRRVELSPCLQIICVGVSFGAKLKLAC